MKYAISWLSERDCLDVLARTPHREPILPAFLKDGDLDLDDDGGHSLLQQARLWFHPPLHLSTPGLPHPQLATRPR